LLYVRILIL